MNLVLSIIIVLSSFSPPVKVEKNFFFVPYGPDPVWQSVDLEMNPTASDLLLWIPGGWDAQLLGVPFESTSLMGQLKSKGFHVGRIGVHSSDNPGGQEAYWPVPQDDVELCVQFLRAHAQHFKYPIKTISLIGRSAGGIRGACAEFTDPTERLFDAMCVIASCSDFTQLPLFGNNAAPYFGVSQNFQIPLASKVGASMALLVDQYGGGNTGPVLIYNSGPLSSINDKTDPHSPFYALLFDQSLTAAGHPHKLQWTPEAEPNASVISRWLVDALH